MNKKFICAAFATLTLVGMTACSENDSPDVPSIPATTFTDATGLTLNVNGAPMIGKTVSFTPDANNSSKGTLTLYSSLNLSDLATKASATEIAGPGVIPGSPKVEIGRAHV